MKINDELDQKFSALYSAVFEKVTDENVPVFTFAVDDTQGNSQAFRETLYAARFNNVVSLENPSFHRMNIKLSNEDADVFASESPLHDLITKEVESIFSTEIADAKFSN